ncbi:MAG: SGNH/GDSL hydrolase family protein [Armatimonadota bacterium]
MKGTLMDFATFVAKLKDPAVDRVTIVAIGDSNTELTWHTRGRLGWPGLLQEALFETYGRGRCYVINAGRAGESAPLGLQRLDRDVFRFDPDLVIISFGMNAPGPDGIADFHADIVEMIRRCRERGAAVMLRTPNPIICSPGKTIKDRLPIAAEMPGVHQGLFAAELVKIGAEQGCPVVDHYTLWMEHAFHKYPEEPNTRWLRMSDEVHPGPQGHLVFYREMAHLFDLPQTFPWEE